MLSARTKAGIATIMCITASSCSEGPVGGRVSLVEIIVEPERYVGGRVIVHGYLHERATQPWYGLYLAREFAEINDISSSVLIADLQFIRAAARSPHCRDVFVMLVGTFGETELGSPGIVDVEGAHRFSEDGQMSMSSCWQEPEADQH